MSKLDELIEKLCPNGVEFKKLGEVCNSLKKGTLKTSDLNANGKYPVINSGRELYGFYDEYNNKNAITIAARGEYAGYINYFENEFWAGGLCYPYSSKNEEFITNKFLYYYLKKNENKIMKNLVARGSIPALNKSDLDRFLVPVPPLEVQCEIVRILDNFTLLSAELSARQKQYKFYRDELIKNAKNVKKQKLSEIAEIYDGTHQTPKYTDSGIKFISVENISDIYHSNKYISKEDYDKYKVKPKINDVFMTRIGTIGKCSVCSRQVDLAYYVSLALIRPNSNVLNSYYLKYLIESIIGIKELRKRTLVNAVPIKINKEDIGRILLPIPPLEEQERIVNILEKFDKLCNDISQGLPAEIEARQKQYEYYRDKLLAFKELKIDE
ncbi:restriction endonuclease subunit S [Campylobacter lanienae]|uniref:restriction endonuclease subunit S n=1 Tax=Campylobacter lanienae TaxID=75658 RepID=UPI003EFC22FA